MLVLSVKGFRALAHIFISVNLYGLVILAEKGICIRGVERALDCFERGLIPARFIEQTYENHQILVRLANNQKIALQAPFLCRLRSQYRLLSCRVRFRCYFYGLSGLFHTLFFLFLRLITYSKSNWFHHSANAILLLSISNRAEN